MPNSKVIASSTFDRMSDLLLTFPSPTRSRGLQYATTGRVQPLEWTGEGVRAKVRGTSIYMATWRWNGQAWNGACSCPMRRSCKHLYAVGLEILRTRRDVVPGAANDAPDLAELRSASDPWRRTRALSRLILGSRPELEEHLHRAPIAGFLEEDDFDLMCWQVAGQLARLSGGWLPPALEPWRDRPDLAKRHRADVERRLLEELGAWAERAKPLETDRSVRILLSVVEGTSPMFALEVRLTSPRLSDEPRTPRQVGQLVSDARRHPGRLPIHQIALLESLLDAEDAPSDTWNETLDSPTAIVLDQAELWKFLAQAESRHAVTWHDDMPQVFGVTPGEPVRLGPEPLTIVPECEEREGRLVIDLFVRGASGLRARIGDVLYVPADSGIRREPVGIVVHQGTLHRLIDRPPDTVVQAFRALEGLLLDAERDVRLVSMLARAFPELRTSLRTLAAVRPVTPVIAVDVRESDWIQLRVFSVPAGLEWTPDQPPAEGIEEYVPGRGWRSAGAPFAMHRFELSDDESLAPALAWLARTGAHQGTRVLAGGILSREEDRDVGWWLPMSARRLATFAAAWKDRPPDVRWYCTPRARKLLVDRPLVRARVSVRNSGLDFFELSAAWEAEGAKLTQEDFARLASATGPYVRISSGWVRLDTAELATQQATTLAEFGVEVGQESRRLSLWELARARPEALEALAGLGMDEATRREIERLRRRVTAFSGLPRIEVPRGFVGTLRHYQQDGLDFLAHASTLGLGAVLADDMGLGKTIQALAWLLWLRENDPRLGPILVVCPASVVHNWEREAGIFAPGLRVALVTSGVQRSHVLERAGEYDLMVTNYSLLRRDIERWQKVPLGAAILDEAQFVKNPDAAVSRAVLELRAKHRLALTGTPLENRALDLWSILAFVEPGLLGTRRQFSEMYDRADTPVLRRRMLVARLRPVLLRRLKSEVARDLPPRIEERRDCDLGPRQRALYATELVAARKEIEAMSADAEGMRRNKIQILARLTRLRQICCHPSLVPAGHGVPATSGKFEALWELLEPLLAEGQKVLVFSQFVRCLDLLADEMTGRDIPHHMLTGATKRRGEVVAAFENDQRPCVFLISLKAGGTGLNLTAASYVVLFDPWWNPAVEAQAIDRTHRIGQTQTVIAYRMLALGTIEEKIWELQNRKAALSRELLGEDGFAKALTREDLAYLLEPAGAAPRAGTTP